MPGRRMSGGQSYWRHRLALHICPRSHEDRSASIYNKKLALTASTHHPRHSPVLETELVTPKWSLHSSRARVADLPGPEIPVVDSVHTGKHELAETVLHSLVPVLPLYERCAVALVRGATADTVHVESAIVNRIAKLASDRDTEVGLRIVETTTPRCTRLPGPHATARAGSNEYALFRDCDRRVIGLSVKGEVWVHVEYEPIRAIHPVFPSVRSEEAVVYSDDCNSVMVNRKGMEDS